jgi:two-component system, NtrC family, sensor kinase
MSLADGGESRRETALGPPLANRLERPSSADRRRPGPGLRLQIVLALAGVILVAYVPLFFAISQITRATSLAYRDDTARSVGGAVAAHVADVQRMDPAALQRTVASHVGEGGALAVAVYSQTGDLVASAAASPGLAPTGAPRRPYRQESVRVATRSGRALDVVLPSGGGAVLVRMATEDDPARTAQLVRGTALYMSIFALALLVFAYIALTRTIVRPVEQLARAADRVATGARDLDVPRSGAREVAELGASVRAMAARLLSDEKALRDKVDELTTTTKRLGEAREQLAGSERLASIGRLAAGVAHEIGNPIAAIMGMHDILEDGDLALDTRADFLRRMRKETERIHLVVRDLLEYARPETGPLAGSANVSAAIAEVVDDALSLVRPQKEWRGITLDVDVDADLRVAISPQRLTQVLLNLLLNAAAALSTKPSGEPRTIRLRARPGEERVLLEIEDDGPGVARELRDGIFEPFVTTKDVGAGTGLGLAVCRGIVEAAKGKISLDASYEAGARFVVELPLARE